MDREVSRRRFLHASGAIATSGVLTARSLAEAQAAGDSADGKASPLDRVLHFPDVAVTAKGCVVVANTMRKPRQGRLGIQLDAFRRERGLAHEASVIVDVEGISGVDRPFLAAGGEGMFVRAGEVLLVFAYERDDQWRVQARVFDESLHCRRTIDVPSAGRVDISPVAVVMPSGIQFVWESDAEPIRGIFAWHFDGATESGPRRISSLGAAAYNPAATLRSDGTVVAAWDTVIEQSADIYGACFTGTEWTSEHRLTRDARIERHPHLVAHGDELWMCWQAQAYGRHAPSRSRADRGIRGTMHDRSLNNVTEQRIGVARVDGWSPGETIQLSAPRGLFDVVSTGGLRLMRPRITFDAAGRLWLTAREGMSKNQAGWQAAAWCYDGQSWSGKRHLSLSSIPMSTAPSTTKPSTAPVFDQGRWDPIPIVLAPGGDAMLAAVQMDDLPKGWDSTRGQYRDWYSVVGLVQQESVLQRQQPPRRLPTVPLEMPATVFDLPTRVRLAAADFLRQTWKCDAGSLSLFWGDLHDHTDLSVCNRRGNPPCHDLYANLRDIEKLDFCATTDHGYNYDAAQWAYNGEQVRSNHEDGRFVTFLGEEWTSDANPPRSDYPIMKRYGHHNIIFLDPYHREFHDAFDGDISPEELWERLAGSDFLCIPHQLADWRLEGRSNVPTDWTFVDERLQPVAEIFQTRQSYEYLGCPRQAPQGAPFRGHYLQDAWAAGVVIGVIASPDHGGGCGKVGVWAPSLDRRSIFESIRARHTFGTSGAKMSLRLAATDSQGRQWIMGDKAPRGGGPIHVEVVAAASCDIDHVTVFRNNEPWWEASPSSGQVALEREDPSPPSEGRVWYYARIMAEDAELAWSSPIWFV